MLISGILLQVSHVRNVLLSDIIVIGLPKNFALLQLLPQQPPLIAPLLALPLVPAPQVAAAPVAAPQLPDPQEVEDEDNVLAPRPAGNRRFRWHGQPYGEQENRLFIAAVNYFSRLYQPGENKTGLDDALCNEFNHQSALKDPGANHC